jgi:hypothetical protein
VFGRGANGACKECLRIRNRAYFKSDNGKAAMARYERSAKGKAAIKRYHCSPAGRATHERYRWRVGDGPKGGNNDARMREYQHKQVQQAVEATK